MAKKIYRCGGSQPSLNIVLPNGKPHHVTFLPHTNGGSTYITDNKDVQWGLEHHAKYGKLYTGSEVKEVQEPTLPTGGQPDKTEGPTETVITVGSMDEAVEYIANNIGISRSKLKTPEAIKKAASKNNIKFSGVPQLD